MIYLKQRKVMEMTLEKWTTAANSWKNINAKFSGLIKKNLSIIYLSFSTYQQGVAKQSYV